MGIPLEDVIATFSAERQQAIADRTAEMIAEQMTLQQLRKAMGKTQAQLAKRLGKPQAAISRIEGQSDMLLSTLNEVMEAMGGRVRILAVFPGRAPVEVDGFADFSPEAKASKRVAGKAAPGKVAAKTKPAKVAQVRRAAMAA